MAAALLGSYNSRALPTLSLCFLSPAGKRAREPIATLRDSQEATWPHPNVLGRGGCSPRRTLLFLFQWLLTQHPLGEEVHTLTDEPCREQVPEGPRERGEMSQKHGLMAIPMCSKTKPGNTAVSKRSHS